MRSSSNDQDYGAGVKCEFCGYASDKKHLFCPSCKKLTYSAYPWRAFFLIIGANLLVLGTLVLMRVSWDGHPELDVAITVHILVIVFFGIWLGRNIIRLSALRRNRKQRGDLQ